MFRYCIAETFFIYSEKFCSICDLVPIPSVTLSPYIAYILPPLFVGGIMSYLCYLCLVAFSDVQHVWTIWVTCLIRGRNCLHFASTWVHPRFLVRSELLIFFFLSVLCFVWLRPVFSVPNAASVSGLSIFDLPFHFLIMIINKSHTCRVYTRIYNWWVFLIRNTFYLLITYFGQVIPAETS